MTRHLPTAIAGALVLAASALSAQGRPVVSVTPLIDADGVRAGSHVKLALRVALPEGVHVQSDAPRDPMLIATRLTVEAPAGITASEIVYPAATDFKQAGQQTPLAVFEQKFVVGIAVAVDPSVAPGAIQVPVRLRYQACDASTCFPPSRQDTTFALKVVSPQTPIAKLEPALFAGIGFRR